MSKLHPSEQISGALAFALSGLFYFGVVALLVWTKNRPAEPLILNSAPVNLSFSQVELRAAEPAPEPPPEVQPEPEPVPEEPLPDPVPPEPEPEPAEPEPEEPPLETQPEPVKEAAQVTQAASAPQNQPVDKSLLLNWVQTQIEKEKVYPQSARNAGYEGQFNLRVKIGADGKISEAVVMGGRGHLLLRRSLEKILAGLPGRDFGRTLDEPSELSFVYEFKLK